VLTVQGSHTSRKVPDFFCKISRPWKILENGFGPGKSWNFLGYDVVGGHSDAGADAKMCENYWLKFYLYCIHVKVAPDPIVTAVFLYILTLLAYDGGPGTMLLCFWKVVEKSWEFL